MQIPHVTPYVVGDLSIEEAEDYFEKHVLPRYGMSLLNPSIYTYCGSHDILLLKKECKELEGKFDTHMLIIDMYVGEYKMSKGKLEGIYQIYFL